MRCKVVEFKFGAICLIAALMITPAAARMAVEKQSSLQDDPDDRDLIVGGRQSGQYEFPYYGKFKKKVLILIAIERKGF